MFLLPTSAHFLARWGLLSYYSMFSPFDKADFLFKERRHNELDV